MDLSHIDQIKADAARLTARTFRDLEEEGNFQPTYWSLEGGVGVPEAEVSTEPSLEWSLKDLQTHAESLGVEEVNKLNSKAKALEAIEAAEKGDE